MSQNGLMQRVITSQSAPSILAPCPPPAQISKVMRIIQNTLLNSYFILSTLCIHAIQWLGAPLLFIHSPWYYTWQASAKESYALLLLSLNKWCTPSSARISGDASTQGQIRKAPNSQVTVNFPERLILIANHQIYTDWVYLWYTAYASHHHGHLIVLLKASLATLPLFGRGMKFFSWVFLSRKWETDKLHIQQSMRPLQKLNPMWLMLFPEGTVFSQNTHDGSRKWAEGNGYGGLKHALMPRWRGLYACLEGLRGSVAWLYDCTIAYEGIPPGEYGENVYSLKKLYVEGRKAPKAHIYWRRFAISDIPTDEKLFQEWLIERWIEKDGLLEEFNRNGGFPNVEGYVETDIGPRRMVEVGRILIDVLVVGVLGWGVKRLEAVMDWMVEKPLGRLGGLKT